MGAYLDEADFRGQFGATTTQGYLMSGGALIPRASVSAKVCVVAEDWVENADGTIFTVRLSVSMIPAHFTCGAMRIVSTKPVYVPSLRRAGRYPGIHEYTCELNGRHPCALSESFRVFFEVLSAGGTIPLLISVGRGAAQPEKDADHLMSPRR